MYKNIFQLYFVVSILICSSIFAQVQKDSTALSGIKGWTEAFNKKDLTRTLSYVSKDYGGYFVNQVDQDYGILQKVYEHVFKNNKLSVRLSYHINDFTVSGEMLIIRLLLITTAQSNSQEQVAYEKGMQIWKNENGGWKLFRSISYPTKTGNQQKQ